MAIKQDWKDTVQRGVTDARWDEYDNMVRQEFANYNCRFGVAANWLIGKAILWTESGGPDNPSWKTRPMQIGNPGDPGFGVLKDGKEGSQVIMEPSLFAAVKGGQVNVPGVNVRAGIAYLFTRMAKWAEKSIPDDKDRQTFTYTVVRNDSLWSIAQSNGTTVEELKKMNPAAAAGIKPGQKLNYHKAKMGLAIESWRAWQSAIIASRYNVGDPDYGAKLDYLLTSVFPQIHR